MTRQASEVDDRLRRGFGGIEIVGVGTGAQVLPTAIADDEHNAAGLDLEQRQNTNLMRGFSLPV